MSRQGNLDSFFGIPKEKRVQKQAKLSFAAKPKATQQPKDETVKNEEKVEEKNKENASNHSDDLMDTDEEDNALPAPPQERKRNADSQKSPPDEGKRTKRAQRKVIQDSDDEEEEFEPNDDVEEEDEDDMLEEEDEDDMQEKKEKNEKPITSTKKSVNDVLKQKSTPKPSKGTKKSELAAHAMKTDADLLTNEKSTWTDHVSYAAVCETFERIEEITGRLEIQEILTELFRRVLLRNPKDMYQLIYLVSNTVAPAYECVELGIGDSILIKAIGEAYGTNPCKQNHVTICEGTLL